MESFKLYNHLIWLGIIHLSVALVFSQTAGINSGSIYTLKSKASNRLLNISNSSMIAGGNVDTWTDTKSDAQRWIITYLNNNLYTLTNIASGKLLHIANAIPANAVNIDQSSNTDDNTTKWSIVDAGGGYYQFKTAANTNYSMDLFNGNNADGANVQLWTANPDDPQKWLLTLTSPQAAAPTSNIADQIYEAWKSKYYFTNASGGYITGEGFWGVAEMMEIIDDAYEVTGSAKYKTILDELFKGFIAKEGSDWMWNDFNDDIAWMVIASTRASLLTGNTQYLDKAKEQFDKMYARAATNLYGGGLIWKQGIVGKNSCINGPAMVACGYLAQATGDKAYYTKAIEIFKWSKLYLFNNNTGKVNDNYGFNAAAGKDEVGTWSSTYNQGTYLGAAVMLYNYTQDTTYLNSAVKIADFTKNNMYKSEVINNEEGPDLNGFKGIFMRYARHYAIDLNKPEYIPWLQLNAKVAYNNRNSQNLIGTLWGTQKNDTTKFAAFNASTAMSLLFNCPLSPILKKNAYANIESENMDYLKGVVVEKTTDASGGNQLGGIQNGYYSAYMNVDFGTEGATSASFSISSATQGGTIEIHLGSVMGTLIGTASVTGTGDWNTYATVTCPVSTTKGLQNVYLVYKGSGYLFNFNNFKFLTATNTKTLPNETAKINITIYTSSFSGQIILNAGSQTLHNLRIQDVKNKLWVYHAQDFSGSKKLDISELPKGVYFLSAKMNNHQSFVAKFIR